MDLGDNVNSMMSTLLRPNWIEIDRNALVHNVQLVRTLIGPDCLLMAVVKANAYGHGAAATAHILTTAGADRLAVATLSEGVELRQAGIQVPILVLGYTPGRLAEVAVRYRITVAVYDLATAQALAGVASPDQPAAVHVKINTGMNRLGLLPAEALDFLKILHTMPQLDVEGIFTHFATSDLDDKNFAWMQFRQFQQLLDFLNEQELRPALAHAANSAAMLTMPETHLDMVRTGIALYGLHPDPAETRLPAAFRPALRWKTEVAQVRIVQPGETVSYGREFIAAQPMTIAVLPVGYADGFPRRPFDWGSVLIHGRAAPLLGRVCMDQVMVDVTALVAKLGPVCQGDEVVLIGHQGEAKLTAEMIADRLGTNNYDVVSRILARVPRIVVPGCKE